MTGQSQSLAGIVGFRWSSGTGMTAVDDGTIVGSAAYYVSADGSILSGPTFVNGETRGYLYDWPTGQIQLLPQDYAVSDLSADGQTVALAGRFGTPADGQVALWTEAGGLVQFPSAPDGGQLQMTRDAQTAFVSRSHVTYDEGATWIEIGPTVTSVSGISDDGRTIVGDALATDTGDTYAMIWDPDEGVRDLNVYLATLGMDLTGWYLDQVSDVSADGQTIVGSGLYQGTRTAFMVILPEPSTGLLLTLAVALAARRRRPPG